MTVSSGRLPLAPGEAKWAWEFYHKKSRMSIDNLLETNGLKKPAGGQSAQTRVSQHMHWGYAIHRVEETRFLIALYLCVECYQKTGFFTLGSDTLVTERVFSILLRLLFL